MQLEESDKQWHCQAGAATAPAGSDPIPWTEPEPALRFGGGSPSRGRPESARLTNWGSPIPNISTPGVEPDHTHLYSIQFVVVLGL